MAIFTPEFIREYTQIKERKVYRLHQSNGNGKIVQPAIPNNYFTRAGYEDSTTKRVCFAPNINKCLMALSQKCTDMILYVHIPDGNYEMYKPRQSECPDVGVTGEIWILRPVKLKCIGKIHVIGDAGKDGHPFKYGDHTAELYDWDWEWIERY